MSGDKRGVWRLWAWGRKGRRGYTLRDAQSEEDVCLYTDPVPGIKKAFKSEDHLLDRDKSRPHAHSDDDEGDSEVDRSESACESVTWRADSQDSEDVVSDRVTTESEVENTESESEDTKKDGGAVQTIVERLRACGAGHGRAGDDWSSIDTWTSHDLRQFLINKAQLELGGPYANDSTDSIEMKTYMKNTRNVATSRQVTPAPAIPTPPGAIPRPVPSRPRGRGTTAASALIRRHSRPRMAFTRNSLQLDQMMRRDMSPPPPRARLWSLPAIIVTATEDSSKTPSPPGHSNSLTNSMNYLTVPSAHAMRLRQDAEDTQSEPCTGNETTFSCEGLDKTVNRGLANSTKLGSIMDLWSGQWEVQDESEARGGRPFSPGSPPPDPRPQAAPEYLQYEESFVSVNVPWILWLLT